MKAVSTTGSNRLRFAKKSERIKKIDIDIVHRIRTKKLLDVNHVHHTVLPDTGDQGCFFQDELERCKDIDSTSMFKRFYYEMFPLVQSLPELLFHTQLVIEKFEVRLRTVPLESLASYLHLLAVLARDLDEEFKPFFHRVFSAIVQLLHQSRIGQVHDDGNELTPEIAEKIFECLSYLLKYNTSTLVMDPDSLRQYYGLLLGHPVTYIRDLSARCFSVIVRKLPLKIFKSHIKKVTQVIAGNCLQLVSDGGSFCPYALGVIRDKSYKSIQSEVKMEMATRLEEVISGLASLIFYSSKGVKGCLHSSGGQKIQACCQLLLPLLPTAIPDIESIVNKLHEYNSLSQKTLDSKEVNGNANSRKKSKHHVQVGSSKEATSALSKGSAAEDIASVTAELACCLEKINEKLVAFVFTSGQVCLRIVYKLFRYQHPSNMAELWLRLMNFVSQLTTLAELLLKLEVVVPLKDTLLSAVEVASMHVTELLVFAVSHSDGRAISDPTVRNSVSKLICSTCLKYCEASLKLWGLDRTSVTSPLSENHVILNKCLTMLVCRVWRIFVTEDAVYESIDGVLAILLPPKMPSTSMFIVSLLSEELLSVLPPNVLSDTLMKPLLTALIGFAEDPSVDQVAWLSLLIPLLFHLKDVRQCMKRFTLHSTSKSRRLKGSKLKMTYTDDSDNENNFDDDENDDDDDEDGGYESDSDSEGVNSFGQGLDVGGEVLKYTCDAMVGCSHFMNTFMQLCLDILLTGLQRPSAEESDGRATKTYLACQCVSWCLRTRVVTSVDEQVTSRLHCLVQLVYKYVSEPMQTIQHVSSPLLSLLVSTACDVFTSCPDIPLKPNQSKKRADKDEQQVDTQSSFLTTAMEAFFSIVCSNPRSISALWTLSTICDKLKTVTEQQMQSQEDEGNIHKKVCIFSSLSEANELSLIQALTEALSSESHWIRLCALRIATHLPIPRLSHVKDSKKQGDNKLKRNKDNVEDDIDDEDDDAEFVDVISICLQVADTPITVGSERDFARHVSRLEVFMRGGRLPSTFARLICSFAIGLLNVKFKPFWEPVVLVLISAVGTDAGEDLVWPILLRAIQQISPSVSDIELHGDCSGSSSDPSQASVSSSATDLNKANDMNRLSNIVSKVISYDNGSIPLDEEVVQSMAFYFHIPETCEGGVFADARTDSETVYISLWDVLKRCPSITLRRSKVVVPLFFRFLRYQYYTVFSHHPEVPDLHRIGLFAVELTPSSNLLSIYDNHTEEKNIENISPKILQKRMEMFLKVFSAVSSPKQLYQHPLLYAVYCILLSKPDTVIAKLAFDCITTYKSEALVMYTDNLRNLLDDKAIRNELAVLDVSENSNSCIVQAAHRPEFIPLLIRLLYGRFASRSRASKAAREQSIGRRSAILAVLARLSHSEVHLFLHLMLRSLLPKKKFLNLLESVTFGSQQDSRQGHGSLALLSNEWHEAVREVALSLTAEDMQPAIVGWETQLGFLHLLEQVIRMIGFGFSRHVDLLTQLVLAMMTHAQTVRDLKQKQQQIEAGDGNDDDIAAAAAAAREDVDDEALDDEDENDEKGGGDKEDEFKHCLVQAGKVRSLCLLRLSELVLQYHTVFDFVAVGDDLWGPMSTLLEALPSSVCTSSHPPALLKLIHSLVIHEKSLPLVVSRSVVVEQVIKCISSKCDPAVAKMVMDIIMELMEWEGGQAILPLAELVVESFCIRFADKAVDLNTVLKISNIFLVPSSSVKLELHLLCGLTNGILQHPDVQISTFCVANLAVLLLGMLRSYTTSRKIRVEEDTVLDLLNSYKALLWRIDCVHSHVAFISSLIGPAPHESSLFNTQTVRSILVETYVELARHPSVSKLLSPSADAIMSLTAVDMSVVGGRDFDRCMPVYQGLSGELSAESGELKSTWDAVLGPTHCGTPRAATSCNVVVFECLRSMYDEELVVRSAALAALKSLVFEAVGWVAFADVGAEEMHTAFDDNETSADTDNVNLRKKNSPSESWIDVVKTIVIPGLHKGLKQSTDMVKRGFVTLLAHLIRTIRNNSKLTQQSIFHCDLYSLMNIDPEQDFFENIVHIQLHRRARAMARLKTHLTSSASSPSSQNQIVPTKTAVDSRDHLTPNSSLMIDEDSTVISTASLTNIILPLTYHPLFGDEFEKKDHQNLLNEAGTLLGAVALHLPWSKYLGVIRALLRKLEKEKQEKEKVLLSALCSVLDSFHFDLDLAVEENEVMDNDGTSRCILQDSNDDNDDDDDDHGDNEINPVDEIANANDEDLGHTPELVVDESIAGEGSSRLGQLSTHDNAHAQSMQSQRVQGIVKIVTGSIMPWVRRFLIRHEKDHKGNQSTVVRTQVALALTKLVSRLQPPVVSVQKKLDLFNSLVITVIGTMKSRDSSARDTARDSLAKMVTTMGMESLYTVIYELQQNLKEGYQRQVCSYSLRSILGIVLASYTPPVDAYSIPITPQAKEKEVNELSENVQLVAPQFDKCLPLIMTIVGDDLAGVAQEEREIDGAVRTLIREAKGSKANDILEQCAKCVLFRPTYALKASEHPASLSSVHALVSPLLTLLRGCHDKHLIGRVGEALQRIALGFAKNESLTTQELLLYLHSTIQPFILIIMQDHRHNEEVKGQVVSKKRKKNDLNVSNDDEDEYALSADLPSYFREDSSDEDDMVLNSKRTKNQENKVRGLKPSTWLPSDRKTNSGHRAALEERDREARERILVQDGVSAPKLTGRNKHSSLSVQAVANANSNDSVRGTDPCTLTAVRYCLSLLIMCLKQNRLNSEDQLTRSMITPFLPLLAQCLKLSGAATVVALAMRCLCTLLSWGLYVKPDFSRAIGRRMIALMCRGGALISTDGELVQACMKGLTALYQLYNKYLGAKRTLESDPSNETSDMKVLRNTPNNDTSTLDGHAGKPPVDEEGLRSLLSLLTASIIEIGPTYQNSAFQLLRAIVDSKAMVPEVYDLVSKLTDQIVLSHRKGIREAASGIVISFMLHYPIGEKRFAGHVHHLINNCSYEYEEGREAALDLLGAFVRLLPVPVLDTYALTVFLPMTLRLVNDSAASCRKRAAEVLLCIMRRVSVELTMQFLDYSARWLGSSKKEGNNECKDNEDVSNQQKWSLVRIGAQIGGILVHGRPDLFKKNNNVLQFIQLVSIQLMSLVGRDIRRGEDANVSQTTLLESMQASEEECVGGTGTWIVVYHLLLLLEKMFSHLPAPTDLAITHTAVELCTRTGSLKAISVVKFTNASNIIPIMETVQECLVYPHAWVRATSCRLIQLYLSRRDALSFRLNTSADGVEVLLLPNGMYHLARRLCIVLNQSVLEKSLLDAIIGCLLFVIQAMNRRPDLARKPEIKTVSQSCVDTDERSVAGVDVDDEGDDAGTSGRARANESAQDAQGVDEEGENGADVTTGSTLASKAVMRGASGENWVLQRLRGLAVDRRGRRRLYVLKVFAALITVESADFVRSHLQQFLEACLRAYNMSHGPDALLEAETKLEADNLLVAIENKVGSADYLNAFREVQSYLKRNKLENKQKLAAEAVANPKSFAERKIARTMKKREGKKRKGLREAAMKGLKKRRGTGAIAYEASEEQY